MARRSAATTRRLDWSDALPDAFILCRDIGHQWRPYRAWWSGPDKAYRRVLECTRCETTRTQLIDRRGHVSTGHYLYPEGYVSPPGMGRVDGAGRDALRLGSLLRLLDDEGPARSA